MLERQPSKIAKAAQLLVFARVPQLGQVKSRLAAQLGATAALALYRQLLLATVATVVQFQNEQAHIQVSLCFAGDDTQGELAALAHQYKMTLTQQADGDLGKRMACALNAALVNGLPAVLIGTDLPTLRPQHLQWAFDALLTADAAFLPAEDGGYGLVGLTRPADGIFTDIAWSTDQVMGQTRGRLAQLGLTWREGETLWDVDTRADLARWQLIGDTGDGLSD